MSRRTACSIRTRTAAKARSAFFSAAHRASRAAPLQGTWLYGLNKWIFEYTAAILSQGKKIGLIGGDHSIPLGYIQALATYYTDYGILQIDAHADLRNAYQGFEFSHASIMHNVLKIPQVSKIVQVGVRDICQAEVALIQQSEKRYQHIMIGG